MSSDTTKDVLTIFCDIDGTILKHEEDTYLCNPAHTPTILPGAKEKLQEWVARGCIIILTTGRPATTEQTQAQLRLLGIPYHYLITNLGSYKRVVINDNKPDGTEAADHHCIPRNKGIGSLDI